MTTESGDAKGTVDDISLEDKQPAKKRGGGTGWLVLIIAVLVIAIVVYASWMKQQQAKSEAEAKLAAAQVRQAQLEAAKGNVAEAVKLVEQDNIPAAIAKLQAAEEQYGYVVRNANESDDAEGAQRALASKGVVSDARQALELEMQRFKEAIAGQVAALRDKFGLVTAETTATEETPAVEGETAADGDAVSTDEAAPADAATPAEGEATDQNAAPAEGATPADGAAAPEAAPAEEKIPMPIVPKP